MKTKFLIILFCFNALLSWSQFNGGLNALPGAYKDTVWIVTGKRELDAHFKEKKLDFVLDARQTLISNTKARLTGIRIGIEYRRVHRFGIGFYGLGDGVKMNSLVELDSAITEAVLSLSYISLFYERVLFFNPKWEWSATAHFGRGQITGKYKFGPSSTFTTFPSREVSPIEFSTIGYYNLTWWCSAGLGVGYRFMQNTPKEVQSIYNAPVGILRLRIKLGKLTKSIWDKNTRYQY